MRGSFFIDIIRALELIGAILVLLINDSGLALQPNPNAIIPPDLQWLYGNQQPGNYFEYSRRLNHEVPQSQD